MPKVIFKDGHEDLGEIADFVEAHAKHLFLGHYMGGGGEDDYSKSLLIHEPSASQVLRGMFVL